MKNKNGQRLKRNLVLKYKFRRDQLMIIDNHFKKLRSCHVFEKADITNFELYKFKIKVKTLICPSLAVAIIKNKTI